MAVMGANGRVRLPAQVLRAAGWRTGTKISFKAEAGSHYPVRGREIKG